MSVDLVLETCRKTSVSTPKWIPRHHVKDTIKDDGNSIILQTLIEQKNNRDSSRGENPQIFEQVDNLSDRWRFLVCHLKPNLGESMRCLCNVLDFSGIWQQLLDAAGEITAHRLLLRSRFFFLHLTHMLYYSGLYIFPPCFIKTIRESRDKKKRCGTHLRFISAYRLSINKSGISLSRSNYPSGSNVYAVETRDGFRVD